MFAYLMEVATQIRGLIALSLGTRQAPRIRDSDLEGKGKSEYARIAFAPAVFGRSQQVDHSDLEDLGPELKLAQIYVESAFSRRRRIDECAPHQWRASPP